ncbi:MAG: DUF6468 domain-containing protein [Pseudomonadota bacterium]
METDIGLILDGVILVFLAVTIFYAARLTLFFKSFRASKESVEKLISDLSTMIDKAEQAIDKMHQQTGNADANLQNTINEASFLSDELRFINETGDNLAGRLEKLVDQNKELVDLIEDNGGVGHPSIKSSIKVEKGFNQIDDDSWALGLEDDVETEPTQSRGKSVQEKTNVTPFSINDRDFDGEEESEAFEDEGAWSSVSEELYQEQEETSEQHSFASQAERDLFAALKKNEQKSDLNKKVGLQRADRMKERA